MGARDPDLVESFRQKPARILNFRSDFVSLRNESMHQDLEFRANYGLTGSYLVVNSARLIKTEAEQLCP